MFGSARCRVRLSAGEYPTRRSAATLTLQVRVGCEFNFDSEVPSASIFQVEPHAGFPHDLLRDSWESDPALPMTGYA